MYQDKLKFGYYEVKICF